MRRLLTVEDHFQITGRGLLIAPAPLISEFVGPCSIDVEVRLPDGRRRNAKLVLQIALQTPSPPVAERRYAALFRDLSKDDVPIGSELWCSEAG